MHKVQAKALLTKWNGMNVYRGCLHGCVYCDSRSTCYQFSHLFEDVEVKENAPELLELGVCTTTRRYEVLKAFKARGIPTVVWMTPLLPHLTDTRENVETILNYCIDAGVKGIICHAIGVTLRDGDSCFGYIAEFPQRYAQISLFD